MLRHLSATSAVAEAGADHWFVPRTSVVSNQQAAETIPTAASWSWSSLFSPSSRNYRNGGGGRQNKQRCSRSWLRAGAAPTSFQGGTPADMKIVHSPLIPKPKMCPKCYSEADDDDAEDTTAPFSEKVGEEKEEALKELEEEDKAAQNAAGESELSESGGDASSAATPATEGGRESAANGAGKTGTGAGAVQLSPKAGASAG